MRDAPTRPISFQELLLSVGELVYRRFPDSVTAAELCGQVADQHSTDPFRLRFRISKALQRLQRDGLVEWFRPRQGSPRWVRRVPQ